MTGKKKQVNVQLDEGLVQFLDHTALAKTHGESKADVVAAALQRLMDDRADALVGHGLQDQLSTVRAELLEALQKARPGTAPEGLLKPVTALEARLKTMENLLMLHQDTLQGLRTDLNRLYAAFVERVPLRALPRWRTVLIGLLNRG